MSILTSICTEKVLLDSFQHEKVCDKGPHQIEMYPATFSVGVVCVPLPDIRLSKLDLERRAVQR